MRVELKTKEHSRSRRTGVAAFWYSVGCYYSSIRGALETTADGELEWRL
jgi:hypothetical protein